MSESEKKEVKVTRTDEKGQEKTHIYTESHIERTPAGDNIHVMTKEEEELSIKAKRAGMAFQDLITSAVDKAKAVTKEKTKGLARHFEGTMNEMRQYSYTDQADLLTGYKKLVEEKINVTDAR